MRSRTEGTIHWRGDTVGSGGVVSVLGLTLVLGPAAGDRVDPEPELGAVGAPAKPFVQPRDRRAGAVGETGDDSVAPVIGLAGHRGTRAHVEQVVAHRPLERRLQLEALALALLVVGGDALGGLGRHVLDAEDVG